ncbi:hypothetical protein ACO2JO_13745 [Leptospira interrogans]
MRKIYRIFLQHVHRMAAVTRIFQFCDPVVEGVQLLFQLLNSMLNWKSPSRIFIDGWSLRWTRTLQASPALC